MPQQHWKRIHQYLGGLARGLGGIALQVGGVDDHIHTLNKIPPTRAVSDFKGELAEEWAKLLKAMRKGED